MGLKITDTEMTSDATTHFARRTGTGWEVSWMPGRVLSYNASITALTLAELAASRADALAGAEARWRAFVASYAAELGLSEDEAIGLLSASPDLTTVVPDANGEYPGGVEDLAGSLAWHLDGDGRWRAELPDGRTAVIVRLEAGEWDGAGYSPFICESPTRFTAGPVHAAVVPAAAWCARAAGAR